MPTKDGKLTYEEMVAIVNRGESVLVNGEVVQAVAALPTSVQVAAATSAEEIEAEEARLEAEAKRIEEARAELKKLAAEQKKALKAEEDAAKEADKSAEANAKERQAEERAQVRAQAKLQAEVNKAAEAVDAERLEARTPEAS